MATPRKKTRKSGHVPDFGSGCKSELHHQLVKDNDSVNVHNRANKDYSKIQLQWLIDHGLFSQRGQFICDTCLDYAKTNLEREQDKLKANTTKCKVGDERQVEHIIPEENDHSDDRATVDKPLLHTNEEKVEEVTNLLKAGCLKDNEVNELCSALGTHFSALIFEDSENISKKYRDINASTNVECSDFLKERPKSLLSFLNGIMTKDVGDCTQKKVYALCLLIEQLYVVRNSNFIGPFSFSQGLFKWTIHGSKISHALEGATTAAGSLRTLKGRLEYVSKTENKCFESGDVDIFADNVQRVGKTTRVREGGTTPVNVACNVVFIQSHPKTSFQDKEELKPSQWYGKTPPAELTERINDLEKDLKSNTYRPFRIQQQQKFLSTVAAETIVHKSEEVDHISVRVSVNKRKTNHKICPKCAHAFENSSPRCTSPCCPKCKYQIHDIPDREVLYGDVPNHHPSIPCSVHMGEIVDLNPNSQKAIKQLLLNIREQGEVGVKRKWVRVGVDGVPYNIAASLLDNNVVCDVCQAVIDVSHTPFSMHVDLEHPGQTDIGHKKLFDYVLLTPGAGHMEINLLRAIFKLCRHICLEQISDLLGFRTKGSKEFVVRGSNHHVTWQVFLIMYQAFALELASVYYVECRRNGGVPSQADWHRWRENDVVNPNYHFYYDLVFYYFMGLFCFRAGVRRNNSKFMLAGRQQVAPIMYIGKHRLYRKLIHRDMQTRVEAPAELLSYIESNESYSKSGDPTRGQGGDYVTEEENRTLKSSLPPGIPTLQTWQWTSRCNDILKQNRANVFKNSGVTDTGNETTPLFNFEQEVQCVRAKIRESGILSQPTEPKPLMSLDRKELHPELVNMHLTLTSNYGSYKETQDASLLNPVFVTQEDEREYNDIKTSTKGEISTRTGQLIRNFVDEDLANFYAQQLSIVSKGTKKTLIDFYYEVKQAVENERAELENSDFETEES